MCPYISLFGTMIPMYGLCMAVGIIVSGFIAAFRAKKLKVDINSVIVIAATGIGIGLIGAKIAYIFATYDSNYIFTTLFSGDFTVLTSDGLVFYGGLIGGIIGAFLGLLIVKDFPKASVYCDVIVPCIPIGHAFGRLGCFFAGCCYGIPYDGIFSVTFPYVGVHSPVLPVQLIEMLLNIVVFVVLAFYSKRKSEPNKGYKVLSLYLILYSIIRFGLEFLRGDKIRGFFLVFSTSQWISIALLVGGIILFAIQRRAKTAL